MAAKKRPAKGYTLFWREKKRRWVMAAPDPVTGEWVQHTLPETFGAHVRGKAIAYVTARLAQTGDGTPARRRQGGATLAEIAPRWIDMRVRSVREGRLAPATVKDNDDHLRTHILPTFGVRPVSQIVDDIPGLRVWLRELRAKVSPPRCRNIVATFRTVLDDAKAEGWVAKFGDNPLGLPALVRELPEIRHGEPITIPRPVVEAILSAPDDVVPLNRRARLCLGVLTGLADGELAGLAWRDLELEAVTPHLHVRLAARLIGEVEMVAQTDAAGVVLATKRVKGKSTGKLGDTKNQYRVRLVPLHAAALAALTEWRDTGATTLLGRKPLPTDPIFPGRGGAFSRPSSARHLRADAVAALLHPLPYEGAPKTEEQRADLAAAEAIAKPLTFHATRRTLLTWLADAGVDEAVRKRIAGHSKGSVTEAHYTLRELARLADAVSLLDLSWPSRTTPDHDTVSQLMSGDTTDGQELSGIPTDTCAASEPTMGFEPTTCGFVSRRSKLSDDVTGAQGDDEGPPGTTQVSGSRGPNGSRTRVSRGPEGGPDTTGRVRSFELSGVVTTPPPDRFGELLEEALDPAAAPAFGDVLDDALALGVAP